MFKLLTGTVHIWGSQDYVTAVTQGSRKLLPNTPRELCTACVLSNHVRMYCLNPCSWLYVCCLNKHSLEPASVDLQQLCIFRLGSKKPHLRWAVLKHGLVVGHAVAVNDVIGEQVGVGVILELVFQRLIRDVERPESRFLVRQEVWFKKKKKKIGKPLMWM